MKNKLFHNIIIDVVLFVVLAFLSLSSFIMQAYLPCGHGQGGGHGAGHGAGFDMPTFLGMNRHEWGDIHMYIGIAFIVLLLVHLIMHWSMLDGFFKRHISSAPARYLLYCLLLILLLATVCPWIFYLV